MLFKDVKTALRVTTTEFDDRINGLIDAARADLKRAGITIADENDPLINEAIITYCRASFGQPDNADRMREIYEQQRRTLMLSTGYTDWRR